MPSKARFRQRLLGDFRRDGHGRQIERPLAQELETLLQRQFARPDRERLVGFACIWLALAIFAADGLLRARRGRLAAA